MIFTLIYMFFFPALEEGWKANTCTLLHPSSNQLTHPSKHIQLEQGVLQDAVGVLAVLEETDKGPKMCEVWHFKGIPTEPVGDYVHYLHLKQEALVSQPA